MKHLYDFTKVFFLSVLAGFPVLCSCSGDEKPLYVTEFSENIQKDPAKIKVMSSNMRYKSSDTGIRLWSARKKAYLNMFSDVQPDIVGLQELSTEEMISDLSILDEYDRYMIDQQTGYTGPATDVTESGTSITGGLMCMWRKSRFECLEKGHFWLGEKWEAPWYWPYNGTDQHCRACVYVKLRCTANGRIIYFFDTHYPYDPSDKPTDFDENGNRKYNVEPRRLCSKLIVERLKEIAAEEDASVFVVGDLNCSFEDSTSGRNGSRSLEPLNEYMREARNSAEESDNAISYNGFSSPDGTSSSANIDHIFYRGASGLVYKTENSAEYGVEFISDHYPITCIFGI